MLREAKEGLPEGIYIRFRTDGSLLARTKTIEERVTRLLLADHCALLDHTEEAFQLVP